MEPVSSRLQDSSIILGNPKIVISWMVSIYHLTSNSSNPISKLMRTISSAPVTIGITVILMFNSFLGYYYYFTTLRVFHTNVNKWLFLGIWVTASPFTFSGLFPVFWQICGLGGLHWSSYFQVFRYPYQSFGNVPERISYNWHRRHLHVL